MSAKLQTELDEKTFGSVKNNLRRSYGEQRENRFLAYQRYADGDRLAYLAKYSKEKDLLFVFVFDSRTIWAPCHSRRLTRSSNNPLNACQGSV